MATTTRTPDEYPTRFIRVNDISMAYQDLGHRKGKVILLIAGMNTQMIAWPTELTLTLIQQGYRVIRYDHRDIGLSTKYPDFNRVNTSIKYIIYQLGMRPSLNYTLDDLAQDATELLKHLNITQAHIIGESMGGMVAQIIAANHPHICRSLGLITTDMHRGQVTKEMLRHLTKKFLQPPKTFEQIYTAKLQGLKLQQGDWPDSEFDPIKETEYQAILRDTHQAQHTMAVAITPNRKILCQQINCPTCIIGGTKDPFFPEAHFHQLHQTINGSKLHIFPGMGHAWPKSLAKPITDCLLDCIKTADQQKKPPKKKSPKK